MGETRVICTASVQESVPRWLAGSGPRLGHRRVRDAPRLDRRAQAARRHQGPPGRPHGRDPAADRALAARWWSTSRRSASARSTSTATCSRPTAAPAARRSPAGWSRSGWRASGCRRGQARALAADRHRRGGLVRDRRRRAAARPRLLRGLDRRGRRQRRDDRRRRARRGAGDRRADAALPSPPRRAARARRRRASRRCARSRTRRSRPPPAEHRTAVSTRSCSRPATRTRSGRSRGCSSRPGSRSSRCPTGVELPPEDGATFAENALPKARAAAAATGAPAIADDSGIEAEALGGAPGRPLGPLRGPRTRPTRRTSTSCCARRRPGSRLRYVCALAYVDPRRGEERVFFGVLPRAAGASRAAGRGGSATTRRSSRTSDRRRSHDGRADRRREGRDQPPRARGRGALAGVAGHAERRAPRRPGRSSCARRRCRSSRTRP